MKRPLLEGRVDECVDLSELAAEPVSRTTDMAAVLAALIAEVFQPDRFFVQRQQPSS